MRFLIYLTVFGLIICVSQVYYDLTIPNSGGKLWGVDVESRGPLNPLAPFQIIGSVLFLYLCARHSKYAWHVITVLVVFSLPSHWFLRRMGIYFRPPRYTFEDIFYLSIWIIALVYIMKLRTKYDRYVCTKKQKKLSEGEKQTWQYTKGFQIAQVKPCRFSIIIESHRQAPTRVSHLQIHEPEASGNCLRVGPVSKSVPRSNDRDTCSCESVLLIGLYHVC